jgi:hypothetical protein
MTSLRRRLAARLTLELMLMSDKVVRILRLVLRILLSLAFLAAAVRKFLPQSGWRERFAGWGYRRGSSWSSVHWKW